MNNIRNPVDKREIVKYIRLRVKRIKESIKKENPNKNNLLILKKRMSELDRILFVIRNDTIRNEINKMMKHIYTKKPSQNTLQDEREVKNNGTI